MIKCLLKSLRQYKKDTIKTPVYVFIESIFDVLIPFLMAYLIDYGINKGDMNYIWKLGVCLIGITFLALFFGTIAGKYAARASAGFAANLRHDMYYAVQKFSFSNIDKFSSASIITRLTTDVTFVQNAFQLVIRIAIRGPLMLLFSLIMSFNISPKLSLIFVCVVPVLAFGLLLIMKKAFPIFERVFKTYDKLNNIVQENIRGIRVVKSYVREDYEIGKFGQVSSNIYKEFSKGEKIIALNNPLMQFCVYICIILISWFGARFIISDALTTGQLMSLIAYVTQILMALMMLTFVLVMVTIAKTSAERITELLKEESDIANCENPVDNMQNGDINFRGVSFSYAKDENKLCLTNANLDIKSGETVGIIGGTGSAKTTLVQLIPRLYDVTKGTLLIGGVDVREYDIESLRNNVAMVLQKNVLFSGTIKDNLRWGNENATDEEMIRVCKLACADDFIRAFPQGYDTHIEQGGTNVSGGQKQRLCIARALLKKPKILILDDSTSAVDTRTDSLIRQAFRDEIPYTTKIIIAQRIASIQEADKIIIMDNGRIDAVGTHEDLLLNNKIYQEVYTSQINGGENA